MLVGGEGGKKAGHDAAHRPGCRLLHRLQKEVWVGGESVSKSVGGGMGVGKRPQGAACCPAAAASWTETAAGRGLGGVREGAASPCTLHGARPATEQSFQPAASSPPGPRTSQRSQKPQHPPGRVHLPVLKRWPEWAAGRAPGRCHSGRRLRTAGPGATAGLPRAPVVRKGVQQFWSTLWSKFGQTAGGGGRYETRRPL